MGALATPIRRIKVEPVARAEQSAGAIGGGMEGAERVSRETMTWSPSRRSPDQTINLAKPEADARGRDLMLNDGKAMGAVSMYKDSIVGGLYRLNAMPDWKAIGAPEGWSEEFQDVVESKFMLLAESQACWLDAAGTMTLTDMVRLAVGGFMLTGEVLATSEWLRGTLRPVSTAFQMISPDRLCNPDGQCDTRFLRRGVYRDKYGRPLQYAIRKGYQFETYDDLAYQWAIVPAQKPWGRPQVFHIREPLLPDQTRGIADMVAALKDMRMTRKFKEITLQNAVINASFAAAIESELPPDAVFQALGGANGNGTWVDMVGQYMAALERYIASSSNIQIDGAKVPHLFPGTKLSMLPMGTPGGVGTSFEESLDRHICAALNIGYEDYSKDFSKSNYSSIRASQGNTGRHMMARKKTVADSLATSMYGNVLEEWIGAGEVPLPPGFRRDYFYKPLMREAFTQCQWIGASRGQVDELKETQAAILRINAGLSTREDEAARLGKDWRPMFRQLAREKTEADKLGLAFSTQATTPGANDAQQTMNNNSSDKETT